MRVAASAPPRFSAFPPAMLVVANLFFFGPAILYAHNAPEFHTSFRQILAVYLGPAAGILLLLTVIGALFSRIRRARYIALLFAFGVLLWLQGNVLVWDYGPLDGRPIDWHGYDWPRALDSIPWISLLGAALLFARHVWRLAGFSSWVLLAVQSVSLAVTGIGTADIPKPAPAPASLPERALELDSKLNIVHVILDAFQGDIFGEIVREDGLEEELQGFVWFRNNLGAFPSTYMSIPAIFADRVYANQQAAPDFFVESLREHAFYNQLHDHGFDVHLVPSWPLYPCMGKYTTCYTIPEPYGAPSRVPSRDALALLDLVVLRDVPHLLKPHVHNDEGWLLQPLLADGRRPGAFFNHHAFLHDYASHLRVRDGAPTYHMLHLMPPHVPLVSNGTCEYIGVQPLTRAAFKDQARCALRMFRALLDSLRTLGVYDSSLIVLQSDHGSGQRVEMTNGDETVVAQGERIPREVLSYWLAGASLALLAVKPPHGEGPLSVSEVPSQMGDVGATILKTVGIDASVPGTSVLELAAGADRPRRFNAYVWTHGKWQEKFLGPIQQYEVNGDVYDAGAWRKGEVILEPGRSSLRAEVDLGSPEAGAQLVRGWAGNEVLQGTSVSWAMGESAALVLPLPDGQTAKLEARLLSFPFPGESQTVTVRVDGERVGEWEVSADWQMREYTMTLPAAERAAGSLVEFDFSLFREPAEESEDVRPLAVLFDRVAVVGGG